MTKTKAPREELKHLTVWYISESWWLKQRKTMTNQKRRTMTKNKQRQMTNNDKWQTTTNDKQRQTTNNNKWQTTTKNNKQQTTNNDKWQTTTNKTIFWMHIMKADHLDNWTTWTTLTNWTTLTILTDQWLIKKIIAEFALFTWSCFQINLGWIYMSISANLLKRRKLLKIVWKPINRQCCCPLVYCCCNQELQNKLNTLMS